MQKPKFFIITSIMIMLLFLFGTTAWANESISFQSVIKGKVVDFNASENGTALAIVENWAEGLISPDNKELTLYRSADMGKTWEEVGWLVDNVYLEKGDVYQKVLGSTNVRDL